MTPEQHEDLVKMDLNEDDFQAVREKLIWCIEKANELNIVLEQHYFHVRKSMNSGKAELVLLDIKPDIFNHKDYANIKVFRQFDVRSLNEVNVDTAQTFFRSMINERN